MLQKYPLSSYLIGRTPNGGDGGGTSQPPLNQGRFAAPLCSREEGRDVIDNSGRSRITPVLFYVIRPCNGLDTIVSNGRKKTMFCLLLDTAVKTVAYRWQVIQIVETLVHRQIRFIPIKEGIEFDG